MLGEATKGLDKQLTLTISVTDMHCKIELVQQLADGPPSGTLSSDNLLPSKDNLGNVLSDFTVLQCFK